MIKNQHKKKKSFRDRENLAQIDFNQNCTSKFEILFHPLKIAGIQISMFFTQKNRKKNPYPKRPQGFYFFNSPRSRPLISGKNQRVPPFFMDNNLFTTGEIRSHKILYVSREFLVIKTRKKKGFW